jgi:hypothetical protein
MGEWSLGADGFAYGGFQDWGSVHTTIFSLWDTPEGQPYVIYALPGASVSRFGGEGTGGHCFDTNYNWLPGRWYRTVVRTWNNGPCIRFGQWVKDISGGAWLLIVYYEQTNSGQGIVFSSPAFTEDYTATGSNRSCCIKNIYSRNLSGGWLSQSSCFLCGQNVHTNYNFGAAGGYFWMMSGDNDIIPNYTNGAWFTIDQPVLPPMDSIVIQSFSVSCSGGILNAAWSLPAASSPQFSYSLLIFGNSGMTGSPLTNLAAVQPEATNAAMQISLPGGIYYAKLSIQDIFGQTNSASASVTVSP